MIRMSERRPRAVSAMKMFCASESTQAITPRARWIPASRSTSSSAASLSRQGTAHLAPDAAEAADDEVVCVGVDHALRAALVKQAAELAGDEELGDGREPIEEGTYAKYLQRDDDDAPGGVVGILDRAERGDRVKRPHEPPAERGALHEREQDRPDGDQRRQCAQQDAQPAREAAQLAPGASALSDVPVTDDLASLGQVWRVVVAGGGHGSSSGRARRPGSCGLGRAAPAAPRGGAGGGG